MKKTSLLILSIFCIPLSIKAQSGFEMDYNNTLWSVIAVVMITFLAALWVLQLRKINRRPAASKQKSNFNSMALGFVTLVILAMLSYPLVKSEKAQVVPEAEDAIIALENLKLVQFNVEGMTCGGCENAVKRKVHELQGIHHLEVSHKTATAIIEFDTTQTNLQELEEAITSAGYKVLGYELEHEQMPEH